MNEERKKKKKIGSSLFRASYNFLVRCEVERDVSPEVFSPFFLSLFSSFLSFSYLFTFPFLFVLFFYIPVVRHGRLSSSFHRFTAIGIVAIAVLTDLGYVVSEILGRLRAELRQAYQRRLSQIY